MSGCSHTQADHEAFKAPGVWETLPLVGYQPGDDERGDIEMRNAPCASTLCVRCMLTEEQREQIRAETRARNASFRQRVSAALAVGA